MAEAVVEGRSANSTRFFCHLCNVEIANVNTVDWKKSNFSEIAYLYVYF